MILHTGTPRTSPPEVFSYSLPLVLLCWYLLRTGLTDPSHIPDTGITLRRVSKPPDLSVGWCTESSQHVLTHYLSPSPLKQASLSSAEILLWIRFYSSLFLLWGNFSSLPRAVAVYPLRLVAVYLSPPGGLHHTISVSSPPIINGNRAPGLEISGFGSYSVGAPNYLLVFKISNLFTSVYLRRVCLVLKLVVTVGKQWPCRTTRCMELWTLQPD